MHPVGEDACLRDAGRRQPSGTAEPAFGGAPWSSVALASFDAAEVDGEAFAEMVGLSPYGRAARRALLRRARQRLQEAGATDDQCAPLDDVAELFDLVLDDPRLPLQARSALWRLQAPVARLALLDADYLYTEPRLLHRLVEDAAAILSGSAGDAGDRDPGDQVETLIAAVTRVADALQRRSALLTSRLHRQQALAAADIGRLVHRLADERAGIESRTVAPERRDWHRRPDRTREREVTERLRRMIDARLEAADAGEPVRAFVSDVWLRHLRSALLAGGESGARYRMSMATLDELLWSIGAHEAVGGGMGKAHGAAESIGVHAPRAERDRLARRIPPLLRALAEGIRSVGARESDCGAFFAALFAIHSGRLGREGAPAALADRPVPERRARLRGLVRRIGLDDPPRAPERRPLSPARAAQALRCGDWIELVDDGHADAAHAAAAQAKVAWIDARRRRVLLVRRDDRQPLVLRMHRLAERFGRRRAFLLLAPRLSDDTLFRPET